MKRNRLLMFITALQLLLFVPLAWWVHNHPVNRLDVKITRNVQKPQFPLFLVLSRCLSVLCSWQFVSLAAITVASSWWKVHQRLEAIMLVNVVVLGTVFRKVLQHVVARPRPNPMLVHVVKEKSSKSFPSGHATIALAGWAWFLVLANMLLKRMPTWQKAILSILFMPIIALAGPSRIYLGEHWASDVIGGYLYGGAWLSFSLQLYLILKKKEVLDPRHLYR